MYRALPPAFAGRANNSLALNSVFESPEVTLIISVFNASNICSREVIPFEE
jgi:hypothetical protein